MCQKHYENYSQAQQISEYFFTPLGCVYCCCCLGGGFFFWPNLQQPSVALKNLNFLYSVAFCDTTQLSRTEAFIYQLTSKCDEVDPHSG